MADTTVKFKADVSSLRAGMQEAQRSVRVATSEFKNATAGLDRWDKSSKGLTEKLKLLDKTLTANKKQAELARKEYDKVVEVFGEGSEEADKAKIQLNKYEAAVKNTEKSIKYYTKQLDDCTHETGDFAKQTDTADKSVREASDGFTVAKGALSDLVASGLKAAIAGLKNLAKYAKEAYEEFDKGADSVIKATGATGTAADSLLESYSNVTKSVVGDMDAIGSALGEISTRFGFTGEELESATEQFIKFADITGTDAKDAVRLVSRAMENAGLDTKNYTEFLDMLAKAGQATGVSVDTLAESVTKMGAPMRQLGFTTEESVAMLAQMEKEGVNTDTVLAGLKKAVAYFGQEGLNAQEGFSKLLTEIKNAPDVTEATGIAIEAFGSKAGAELVEDIRLGKLEYQDFLKVLKNSTGTVTGTYEATQDGFDKVALAIQSGKSEIGQFVRDLATEYQDDIVDFVNKVKDGIKKVVTWFVKNGDVVVETIKSIAKVAATLFAVKKISQFTTYLTGAISTVKTFVSAIKAGESTMSAASSAGGMLSALVSPAGAIVLGLTAIISVVGTIISLTRKETQEVSLLTEEQQKSIDASREMGRAYAEMESARQESMKSVQTEYNHYQELAEELDTLVDVNGKVKAGQEDRAKFIVTTLNDALGTEIQLTDGVIQNYRTEREEIEKLMETKKAQAILEANEAAYADAIEHRTEALTTYVNAQKTLDDLRAQETDILQQIAESEAEVDRLYKESPDNAKKYADAHEYLYEDLKKVQYEVGGAVGAYHEAEAAYVGYNNTIKNYEGLSSAIISGDADKIQESLDRVEYGLKDHTTASAKILKNQAEQTRREYEAIKEAFDKGDQTISKSQVDQAKRLAEQAEKEYNLAGKSASEGYTAGIESGIDTAKKSAGKMGTESIDELNKAQDSHSPSKKTITSGENFAEGYIRGMNNKESLVYKKAYELAQKAIEGLRKGQEEHSPSKLTYKSGENFVQGYINGIVKMERGLVQTVKDMVNAVLKAGLNVTEYEFTKTAESATSILSETMKEKTEYTLAKIKHQNEQKLKDFDATISDLQKKMNAEKDENLKKQYQAQIDEQNEIKSAYQTASQQMLSEFTTAINEYNTKAQNLIDNTIKGVANKYQAQYDALISKQDSLIQKLKGFGSLFEISGAGVMTVNDINAQTKQITDYSKKLEKIKGKVSADLFDEIAALDMEQGSAFIDRLLGLSDKEIKAYSDAYDKKLATAEKSAKKLYNKEIQATKTAYEKELSEAFKTLPNQLEKLGTDAMKGFVSGFTKNTDYMIEQIKTFVKAMVNTFKKDLKIASPSKVMMQIGGFTGAGFVEGLKDTIKSAKNAALDLASSVSVPLSGASIQTGAIGGGGGSVVTNNYNLVQNNTSPKSLSALDTYRARRQQIAMLKALT